MFDAAQSRTAPAASWPRKSGTGADGPHVAPSAPTGVRPTSRATMLAVLVAGLALVALRAPTTLALLTSNMPPEMSAQIHDPRLEGLAMKAGVMAGVVVTAFALLVFLVVAGALERHLFAASRHLGPLRMGLFTLTVGACFITFQLYAMVTPPAEIGAHTTTTALKVVLGLALPFIFVRDLRSLPRGRAAAVVATSALLALLTSVG